MVNTQSNTGHLHLWNRNFWLMVIANLLLSVSVTMLIPTLPQWLLLSEGLTSAETGCVMGIFAVGLYLPGVFCSYLVQHYRRNLVCVWSVLALAVTIVLPSFVNLKGALLLITVIRLIQGMAFGLAQMVLASTLVIDTCDSVRRTEANHSVTWFGRFALSVGPLAGILVYKWAGFEWVSWVSAVCCLVTVLLILSVHFPFRVPADSIHLFSLDRFILTSGWPLMAILFLFTFSVGLLLSLPLDEHFYGLLMIGFLLALLAQRFVFPNAELKSEIVSGMVLVGASILIRLTSPSSILFSPLLGFGMGVVGARILLFFVKLSHHCQRGTSQSTFILGWESGLAMGIGAGFYLFADDPKSMLYTALGIIVLTLACYVMVIHKWLMVHKNR